MFTRALIFAFSLVMFYLSYVASLAAGDAKIVMGLVMYILAIVLFTNAGLLMAKSTGATLKTRKPSRAFATPGFYHSAGDF